MDDFGNDMVIAYNPSKENRGRPREFNWTAYVYFLRPDLVNAKWF
jgi:hypothetical protein